MELGSHYANRAFLVSCTKDYIKAKAKVCAQWRLSLCPRWLATDRSKAAKLLLFLLYVIWSMCFMSYFVFH